MKVSYEWLQSFFDQPLPAPSDIAEKITFGAFEIEEILETSGDTMLDIKVLPDRAHDALSHRGIAREISVLCGIPMKRDPLRDPMPSIVRDNASLTVTVDDIERTPFYAAAHLRNIQIGPSPEWLRQRLEAVGQRSINNVVDATNYVMLELGTPLHAFDAQKLVEKEGTRSIRVRTGAEGEAITVLGGTEYTLTEHMTVIADGNSNAALAIAGVKGGVAAEVDPNTTEIILEAAKFDPVRTRRTAQALKLRTDASQRFENEIATALPVFGLDAGVRLIADIANGTVVGYAHSGMPELFTRSIDVTRQHINRRLGSALAMDGITNLLDRFGFAYDVAGETVSVQVPFERLDLTIPENIIEEIGRVYGYDNIETQPLPPFAEAPIVHPIHAASERIRTTLDALGFTEIYTYSLREEGAVALANSLASDKSHLRENLSDALKEKLQLNENNAPLLGLDVVRLYEIGNVFTKNGEELHVALGVRPLALKKREERAAEEMGKAVTALKEALGVSLPDGDSEVYEFNMGDILTDLALSSYPPAPSIQPQVTYEPFSVYPFALRDVAVWTPNGAPVEDIREVIREHAGALLVRLDLFDAFTKEGRTSYAFHLVFQAPDRTLSEEEITAAMERVTGAFTEAGYEVR